MAKPKPPGAPLILAQPDVFKIVERWRRHLAHEGRRSASRRLRRARDSRASARVIAAPD